MSTKTLMTVEEFAQMATADTESFELVEGELFALSSGTPEHCFVRDFIANSLWSYLRSNPIGRSVTEIDCQVASGTVRRPDVSVFLGNNIRHVDRRRIPVPFAPDIAIEVLSPSESAIEVHRKVREYLDSTGKEVWLIDSLNGEMFIHGKEGIRLLLANDLLESPLLPGFSIRVSEIFAA